MSGVSHLTGKQCQQFHKALLASFDRASLENMVKFELDERLDVIVGGETLSDIVFHLILWAERNGKLSDLIQGSLSTQKGNSLLKAFADSVL